MTQAVRAAPQGSPMTAVPHATELVAMTAARSEGMSGGGRLHPSPMATMTSTPRAVATHPITSGSRTPRCRSTMMIRAMSGRGPATALIHAFLHLTF